MLALLEGKGATDTSPHILSLANEIMLVAQHEAELEASTTWRDVSISYRSKRLQIDIGMLNITLHRRLVAESSRMAAACSSVASLLGYYNR